MFGKNELDSLDEFKKAWDEAPERREPAKDTGAVTNMDDFDYGDTAKDTADAKSITAASTPEVDSIVPSTENSGTQTTQAAIVPEAKPAMTFKQRFAAERKAGATTFDWTGKDGKTTKIAVKLLSEMPKAKAAAVQTAKPKPSTSIFGTGDEHRIAANGETVNHKNKPVDNADAIADKMGIDPNTLRPNKPAVQMASK